MKTITLDKAIKLIQDANAVIIDGEAVTFGRVGYEDEPFYTATYTDDEGRDFEFSFNDEDNKTVKINEAGELVLIANGEGSTERGDEVTIALLVKQNLNKEVA